MKKNMRLIFSGTVSIEIWYPQNSITTQSILMYDMWKNSEFFLITWTKKKKI